MKKILLTLSLAVLVLSVQAKIKLNGALSSNMVLQQNSEVKLWGTSDVKGGEVTVAMSWTEKKYKGKIDGDGKWLVKVETPVASYTPLTITFSDGKESVKVENVLSGDVWLATGQSNMEMPVKGFSNCPVEGYHQVLVDAVNTKNVRFCKIAMEESFTPLDDCQGEWKVCDPDNVAEASATGYFFARMLNKVLDTPIGVLEVNKGGSRVEGWLNEDNLKKYTTENLNPDSIVKNFKYNYWRPGVWYNGTMHPVLNYGIKGIIWYQGCSNVESFPEKYAERLSIMVEQFRKDFNAPDAPFYEVEIAPCIYEKNLQGVKAAFLREQQNKAVELIPNSGIVGNNDGVYPWETEQIHPTQKYKVGERLAALALEQTYGKKQFMGKSPQFKSVSFKDGTAYVWLKDDYDAISRYEDIQGFEVAGEDRVFYPVTAKYHYKKGIIIKSDKVPNPVAVRYCYRNFKLGNVANKGGNPLIPFRTDDWEIK